MIALTFLTVGLAAMASAAPASKIVTMPPHATARPSAVAKNATAPAAANHMPLGDITWIGQLQPGGPNVTLSGHVADIAAQIARARPDLGNVSDVDISHLVNTTHVDHLEKRSNRVSQACWQEIFMRSGPLGAKQANNIAILNGLKYMTTHFSNSLCQVGPKTCGRFSCTFNSATLMCNDNPFAVTIPCSTMIQNMAFVYNLCVEPADMEVQGQAFYINPSYNVLIKHTDAGKGC